MVSWAFMQIVVKKPSDGRTVPNNGDVTEAPLSEECAIRFTRMEGHGEVSMLQCCHSFHKKCITDWKIASNFVGEGRAVPILQ